jgi:outer membrane protein OmpU
MKKVLFATTALIATAGMAAAEVRISGYGRFGLDYNEANGTAAAQALGLNETSITSRLRLQFDMSAETDGGVTFGARFRAQAESRDGVAGGAVFNGARFFVTSGGFTLGVGNIIGAVEGMPGLYLETRSAGVGIDGAGFTSLVTNMGANYFDWDAYSSAGAGPNGVEMIYSQAGFGVHLSYSQANGVFGEENTALNVSYTWNDWTFALGYNDEETGPAIVNGDNDLLVFTVQGDLGIAGVRFAYAQMDNLTTWTGVGAATVTQDVNKMGLYGTFDIGAATTLVAFVTNEDNPGAITDGTGYGFNVSHDLGGGVSLELGAVENTLDNTTIQAGAYFSF